MRSTSDYLLEDVVVDDDHYILITPVEKLPTNRR
jgi:hypothetical protein